MPIPAKSCPTCGAQKSMHASLATGAGRREVQWSCLHCGHSYRTSSDYWALRALLGHQS